MKTIALFLITIGLTGLVSDLFAQLNTKKYNPETNVVIWPEAFHPDNTNFYVYNDIYINAPAEVVWQILIEATEWHEYYEGSQKPVMIEGGSQNVLSDGVTFEFKTMGINFEPTIREFVPNERLAWQIDRRRLKAWHAWVILPMGDGVKLVTAETQNGFLTTMQKWFQPNRLLNFHELWLSLIKERAEMRVKNQADNAFGET
jgi:hypothetical protein